jgi:hypothetical protein
MTDPQSSNEPSGAKNGGCALAILVLISSSFGISLAVILLYSLLVEQWNLVEVPREFGFDMILYAPLMGVIGGGICTYFVVQNPSQRKIWISTIVVVAGLLILLSLIGLGGVGVFY